MKKYTAYFPEYSVSNLNRIRGMSLAQQFGAGRPETEWQAAENPSGARPVAE